MQLKAPAASDRREPGDIVDLVTVHENILPVGAVVCAAVRRFPGQSPEEMLSDITRHSRFTAEEFRVPATESPLDIEDLHRRMRGMIEGAMAFIHRTPSDAVGFVYLTDGKPVQPDVESLGSYQRRAGARGGLWPSSPEISRAILERYGKAGDDDAYRMNFARGTTSDHFDPSMNRSFANIGATGLTAYSAANSTSKANPF